MTPGAMYLSSVTLTLCIVLLATGARQSAAAAAAVGETVILDQGSSESIRIVESGGSTTDASFDFVGLWPHGEHRESDAMFFDEEDAKYEKWMVKEREKKRKQEKEKREEKQKAMNKSKDKPRKPPKGASTSQLTQAAVRARTTERRSRLRALRKPNSLLFDAAWSAVLEDSDNLRKLLSADSIMRSREGEGNNPESQYVQLLSTAFSHTVRNLTTESRSDWISPLIYALPFPVLLDNGALVSAEQEVRALMTDLQVMKATPVPQPSSNGSEKKVPSSTDVEATTQLVEDNLRIASTTISASKSAHRVVAQLALPIMGHAKSSVSDQLREVEKQIRANDESTVAKRRELKDLAKLKKVVKATKDRIHAADGELRNAYFSTTPMLSKSSFLISLALICRLRLSRNTYVDAVDMLPGIDAFADFTGSMRAELYSFLFYPLGVGVAVSAATTWCLLSTRQLITKKLKRQAGRLLQQTSTSGGRPGKVSGITIFALRANLLLEALSPLFVPLVTFYIINRTLTKDLLYPIVITVKPAQRLVLGFVVISVLVASVIVSRVLTAVDRWSLNRHNANKRKVQ
ncbi:hypothetical protein DPX39_100059400 [Trypanosoma brucei equiperdum]|uniref:Uncharacterized protein n=1 Tax=Trypanosoma brucei equiperdum TaxID=630700 RepID=A0A3L6KXM5_9TRYP|nr:hypothetical protein DPX39_100059400 [Trypanosoma brucei equiperdum]